jgi:hypothetical protein
MLKCDVLSVCFIIKGRNCKDYMCSPFKYFCQILAQSPYIETNLNHSRKYHRDIKARRQLLLGKGAVNT